MEIDQDESQQPAASTGEAGASSVPMVLPNPTLYVQNLNEKVKKEELKKGLNMVFCRYGHIIDIVALKTPKTRGQAFIVFENVVCATNAMRELNGFNIYGRPMRVSFARTKSYASMRREDPEKFMTEMNKKLKRKKKGAKGQAEGQESGKVVFPLSAPAQAPAHAPRPTPMQYAAPAPAPAAAPAAEGSGSPTPAAVLEMPNRTLFAQNLPDQANELMLKMLFQQFPGFREARLVPGKAGIAFIDFDFEHQATTAMASLQNFKITPTHLMQLSYAKK
eukprot:tig00000076_g2385.t1